MQMLESHPESLNLTLWGRGQATGVCKSLPYIHPGMTDTTWHQFLSSFNMFPHSLGMLWKCACWLSRSGWGLRFCVSNKILSDDVNVGPRTAFLRSKAWFSKWGQESPGKPLGMQNFSPRQTDWIRHWGVDPAICFYEASGSVMLTTFREPLAYMALPHRNRMQVT